MLGYLNERDCGFRIPYDSLTFETNSPNQESTISYWLTASKSCLAASGSSWTFPKKCTKPPDIYRIRESNSMHHLQKMANLPVQTTNSIQSNNSCNAIRTFPRCRPLPVSSLLAASSLACSRAKTSLAAKLVGSMALQRMPVPQIGVPGARGIKDK